MASFTAATFKFQGFYTIYGKTVQYNTKPVLKDILSVSGAQTFSFIIHDIKHIARQASDIS